MRDLRTGGKVVAKPWRHGVPKKDEQIVQSADDGMANLDRAFRGILSVSNKVVQERMAAEKRKRRRRKARRAKK